MASVVSLIKQAERIALITHVRPDGDAIGSLLGLAQSLRSIGKEVVTVVSAAQPLPFAFLEGSAHTTNQLSEQEQYDLYIVLDLGDLARTGFPEILKRAGKQGRLALIDHHPRGDLFPLSEAQIHQEKAAACAVLVYQLILELGVKITPSIATALLTGIYTDTGGFQHANTDSQVLDIAAELLRRGAKLSAITQAVNQSKSLTALKLLGIALERLYLTHQDHCAISLLKQEELQALDADEEAITGIANHLVTLPGVRLGLLLIEEENGQIRGTLRTGEKSRVNVSQLAKLLGGGGHPRAAGFMVEGALEQTKKGWQVVAQTEKKG